MHTNAELTALLASVRDDDAALARDHAPTIHFDSSEPFLPLAAGYTVFRASAPSHSFPRTVELPESVKMAIEYAIWWDWDIEHLYELEHVWIYLDAGGRLVAADASWHGGYHGMAVENGELTLYSEAGKHAFAFSVQPLLERRATTLASCTSPHEQRGLLVTPLFEGVIPHGTPPEQQLVRTWLEQHLFEPTYDFSKRFALADVPLVPWVQLQEWIPRRVRWWLDTLAKPIPPSERDDLSSSG